VNDQLDRSFLALAHPIRRGIVERLARGPLTVGAAAGGFGVSKPAITKHVRMLEEAGVVHRSVTGRTHRLALGEAPLADALRWLARQEAQWQRRLDVVEDFLRDEQHADD
jgi:DNA-binding transcriptional ArsR family regulator